MDRNQRPGLFYVTAPKGAELQYGDAIPIYKLLITFNKMDKILKIKFLRALFFSCLLAMSGSVWSVTTTPSGSFVLGASNNTSIDFTFTIQSDPGDKSYVFWAQEFWFENGPVGYLGIQRSGPAKKIIFSIWNAKASVALMQGAVAEAFDGEGVGQHVIAPLDWQLGHSYRFRLESAGGSGPWWEVTVTDQTSNEHWDLGKIQALPGWGNLQKNVTTFTEVYINGGDCAKTPYARAAFAAPTAGYGTVKTIQTSPNTYGSFGTPCSLATVSGAKDGVNVGTRSDVVGSSLVHQIGLSNGPQNWGDFDRMGTVGSIFKYANPASSNIEYFRLASVGTDRRYWYFPNNQADNGNWQYLGTLEPFYNGPVAHAWGENDRLGKIGDVYSNTAAAGTTYYFKLIATGQDKRYWYFPTTPTSNSQWQYLGTNIGK